MVNYQDFTYNGNKITFSFKDEVCVNATKMAKAFGKRPNDWLGLQATKDFLRCLSDTKQVCITALVITKRGNYSDGTEQGTWFHKDVAIEFARWLSPLFAIWCNDRILELLTKGSVSLPTHVSDMTPTEEQSAKMAYADAMLAADIKGSFRTLAQSIMLTSGRKITRPQLISWMHDNGYLTEKDGIKNYPTQWAMEMGFLMLVFSKSEVRYDRPGKTAKPRTKITPKGMQHFIHTLTKGLPALKGGGEKLRPSNVNAS